MWSSLFWVSIALLVYVYAGYPSLLAALGRLRRRAPSAAPDTRLPSVCLVVSAHNEEAVIREKIENSLALEYGGRLAIVVASDGSTDRTPHRLELLSITACDGPTQFSRFHVLREVLHRLFTGEATRAVKHNVVFTVGHR